MITYREDPDVDLEQLARLRTACDFGERPPDVLRAQIAGARWVAHAWDGARLVGFARAISDGVSNAYVSTVMVAPEQRRRGIGRELIRRLVGDRKGIKFVLHTRKESAAFYAAIGFAVAEDMLILRT